MSPRGLSRSLSVPIDRFPVALVSADIQISVLSCLDQSNAAALLHGSLCVFCSKRR